MKMRSEWVVGALLLGVLVAPSHAAEVKPPECLIKGYLSRNSTAFVPIKPGEVLYIRRDINGDGLQDWFLYSLEACGSQGCTGDVLVQGRGGKFCYVGFGNKYDIIDTKKVFPNLKCGVPPAPIE